MHDAVERTHGVVRCDGRALAAADTTHTCAETMVGACACDCDGAAAFVTSHVYV